LEAAVSRNREGKAAPSIDATEGQPGREGPGTAAMKASITVQELLDREAIRIALGNYCRGVDRGDWELLATVYHDDAVDDHGDFYGGPEGFIAFCKEHGAKSLTMQHSLGTIIIELDGDAAYSESYFQLSSVKKPVGSEPPLMSLLFGRYLDRFERREGTWRIAKRIVVKDFRHLQPVNDIGEKYKLAQGAPNDLVYELRSAVGFFGPSR
jgi:hypothetical protein